MKVGNKIIYFGAALIFTLFAWLQHEDDNPEIYTNPSIADVWSWIIFYGLVAVSFLLACLNKFPKWLYFVTAGMAIYFMVFSAQGLMENLSNGEFNMTKTAMNPKQPQVEITREFFGALIALLSIGYLYWQSRKLNNV